MDLRRPDRRDLRSLWVLHRASMIVAVCCLVGLPATAEEVVRYETLPGQPAYPFLVDVWTFHCPANGSATVSVDTVALASGAPVALDPAIEAYSPSGDFIVMGDDETPCSVTNVCGFDCPLVNFDCAEGGEQTLLVLTATAGGCGEDWAPYELSVEVFDGLGGSGSALPESEVRLGGAEPIRGFAWGFYPAGPALDDQMHDFFLPDGSTGAMERAIRLRNKTKRDR